MFMLIIQVKLKSLLDTTADTFVTRRRWNDRSGDVWRRGWSSSGWSTVVSTTRFFHDHSSSFSASSPIDDNDATVEMDDDQRGTHLSIQISSIPTN